MLRERLDEYLDDGLAPAERRELEALLASDAGAARLLARMKAERALRSSAYATYTPSVGETEALVTQMRAEMLDITHPATLGRVGYWVRRGAAVAAAIMIVAGTFAIGRMTATPADRVEIRTVYNVVYTDIGGDLSSQNFATVELRDNFVKELEQRGATGIQFAQLTTPGQL